VTAILKRHGVPLGANSAPGGFQRFEQERPNDLWQMDFKGHVPLREGGCLHPLTVLDDHSRYALVVAACGNERGETVTRPI
jgi:transposase InsO family protein